MKPDFLIIPQQLYTDKNLRPIDMIVYGVCYWFEHMKEGKCIASNPTIAKVAGCTAGTVRNSISRLQDRKYINCIYSDPTKSVRHQIVTLVSYVSSNDDSSVIKRLHQVSSNDAHISNNEIVIDNSTIQSDKSDDSFEKFWKSYPKKEAKKKAQSIWETKKLQNCLDTILDFIEKAKHTERWRTSQFIPLPTTFLNQERWTDELASYGIAERRVSVK